MSKTPLHKAIAFLGGQVRAAEKIGRSQSTLSVHLKRGKPPLEICALLEAATEGKFTCEQLRPDLSKLISTMRAPKRRPQAAA